MSSLFNSLPERAAEGKGQPDRLFTWAVWVVSLFSATHAARPVFGGAPRLDNLERFCYFSGPTFRNVKDAYCPMKPNCSLSQISFLLLALAPCRPAASSERADLDRAVSKVFPALVRITVVMEETGEGSMEKQVGAGSGAVITKDGYIITNHHVAGKARHLLCRMSDGEEIEAQLIGTDALADIAIIKLDLIHRKKKAPLTVARFGDSDRVRVGDPVLAMGSPMAVSQSVTKGIVSNTQLMMPDLFWFSQFRLDGESVGSLVRWIGHDAVIFGGNSGGPLVNMAGRNHRHQRNRPRQPWRRHPGESGQVRRRADHRQRARGPELDRAGNPAVVAGHGR